MHDREEGLESLKSALHKELLKEVKDLYKGVDEEVGSVGLSEEV